MKKIEPKEYIDFTEFYSDGVNYTLAIKDMTKGQTVVQRIAFARKYLKKETLNCCIKIGNLAELVVAELETNTPILRFSIDNLVKNLIAHSDVCFEDYLQIPHIAKNPSKILKSKNGYDIMLFQDKEKYYKLIVKTTKNKAENYVKSFHLLREKRYNQYK